MTRLFRTTAGALALGFATLAAGCDSGEPVTPQPQELITRVTVTLTNAANVSDVVTLTATDADGDGTGIVYAASGPLRRGATYTGAITLEDTINDVDITEEVADEADEHLFQYFFMPSAAGAVNITDRESDYVTGGRDLHVGLAFDVAVAPTAPAEGMFHARLYHFDEAPKTSNTATSDEIDVDVAFDVAFTDGPVTLR